MLFFFPPDMARPASLMGDSSEPLLDAPGSRVGQPASTTELGEHAATASYSRGSSGKLLATIAAIAGCSGLAYYVGSSSTAADNPTKPQAVAAAPVAPARDEALIGEVKSLGSLVENLKDQLKIASGKGRWATHACPGTGPEADPDQD